MLERVLSNSKWVLRGKPFRHVTADRLFTETFYTALQCEFDRLLAIGLETPFGFGRATRGYDAYGYSFRPGLRGRLGIFISPQWRKIFSEIFDVDTTEHINAGLHHHRVGSANGKVHNDLNPGWFLKTPNRNGLCISDHRSCDYTTGHVRDTADEAVQVVRAIAILVYFGDHSWREGFGGETGLYSSIHQCVSEPAAKIPPLGNSLLAFECTPNSYHSFISNVVLPRNSMVMWLHQTRAQAEAKWGAHNIVEWPK